jgi:2-oxoisovalerate dehydrogenase E1 component
VIAYGAAVHWAESYADQHPGQSIGILDLRTLLPLDYESLQEAVRLTGKVLVLHEDSLTGGIGAELSAWIQENCFSLLDAPVMRCASLDTPIPFNQALEKNYLAQSRLDDAVSRLLAY